MSFPKDFLKSIYLTGKDGLHLLEHFPCFGMRVASMLQGDDLENTVQKRIACLAIPLTVVGFSALLIQQYKSVRDAQQTAFIPPRWLFAVVWTILLVLMGTASYLVVSGKLNRTALIVYSVQPLFDFMWPLLFFNMAQYLCAFIWPVVWGPLLITTFLFYRISKTAGRLMLLYLVWATFADYLDFPFIC